MADQQSGADLVAGIAEQVSRLVRQELDVARQEAMEKLRGTGVDAVLLAGSGALGLCTLVAGTAAVVDALHGGTPAYERGLPGWAAAGLTAGLSGGAAAWMAATAVQDLRRRDLWPRRTVRELQQAAEGVTGGY
jgi:hypothetical protein